LRVCLAPARLLTAARNSFCNRNLCGLCEHLCVLCG